MLYLQTNKPKIALIFLLKALKVNNNFSTAKKILIKIIINSNDPLNNTLNKLLVSHKKEIEKLLEKWILKEPYDNQNINALISSTDKLITKDSVITILEKAIEKHPNYYNLIVAVSDILIYSKLYDEALKHINRALQIVKHKELKDKLLFQIAFVYSRQNKHNKAIKLLEDNLENNTNPNPIFLLLIGEQLSKIGRSEEALDYINKGVLLANSPILKSLFLDTKGMILYDLNKKYKAIEALKEAYDLNKDDGLILKHYNDAKENKLKTK